jgi:hypothetical protein
MTVTEELPRRPRRKLVTPVTALLTAVLIAALGFIGGVKVQKSSGSTGSSSGFAAARARFGGGGGSGTTTPGGGFSGGGDATVGTVANIDGKSFYVTDSSGNTVKVKTNGNSKVTRTAVSSVGEIHPGDTVIVQGTKASSGTVTAASVIATAKNAATGGLGGLFGGGGGANGAGGQTNQQGSDG